MNGQGTSLLGHVTQEGHQPILKAHEALRSLDVGFFFCFFSFVFVCLFLEKEEGINRKILVQKKAIIKSSSVNITIFEY